MLFTRLYNWIKYKTLPPSVLFLNRLFVERDSKHRRVTSNLGLTFRNSKWSTYARTNINLESRTSYMNLLLKLVLVIISFVALINFTSLFDTTPLESLSFTLMWFLFDADLYLKLAFSSTIACSAQLILNSVYNSIFRGFNADAQVSHTIPSTQPNLYIPKRLHKPLFYTWLVGSPITSDSSSLFQNTSVSGEAQEAYSMVLHNLYKSVHLLKYVSNADLMQNVNMQPDSSSLLPLTVSTSYVALRTDYSLFNLNSSGVTVNDELSRYSLNSIHRELGLNPNTLQTTSGLFYYPEMSYSTLNALAMGYPETSGVRTSVTNQLKVIQWNRWLYKYNILHRSLLSASSSLTFTKRLLNSGFYTSSLSTNNIWASSALQASKLSSANFSELSRSVYGDPYGIAGSNNTFLSPSTHFFNTSNATSFKFYETSYHWFVKRFYSLNNLGSNSVISSSRLNTNYLADLSQSLESYNNASLGLTPSTSTANTLTSTNLTLSYFDNITFSKTSLEMLHSLSINKSTKTLSFYSPYGYPRL